MAKTYLRNRGADKCLMPLPFSYHMHKLPLFTAFAIGILFCSYLARAQSAADRVCPRPAAGSAVEEPADLRSQNGVLEAELTIYSTPAANGSILYCYVDAAGHESPNLRVHPGDLVILHLKNALTAPESAPAKSAHSHAHSQSGSDPCTSGIMSSVSTNLHFHGLTISPVCHQDDVLKTSIQPGDPPFEYRFHIPADQPPGLYWYHPHLHGFSRAQVVGGASGALIVEGIESANREAAGLPERVLVIRDQDLLNPNAAPSLAGENAPAALLDRDGDARNTGNGSGKP